MATNWWEESSNISAIRNYAHMAGLLLLRTTKSEEDKSAVNITLTLLPSKFPKELFDLVWSIQPDINALIDAVSKDHEFLVEALQNVVKTDDFTRKLFQLYKDSREARKYKKPEIIMGIHRCDYLLDYRRRGEGECLEATPPILGIKQVEINTISVAFPGLSQGYIQNLHQFVNSRYSGRNEALNIPTPSSVTDGLAATWKCYGKSDACVLLVEDKCERNIYDQRALEFDLWKRFKIKMFRKSFEEIRLEMSLNDQQELFISNLEVAVVYYRTAYTPEQLSLEEDWSTRLLLECSRAVMCPSVAYQLVGTKKIQQVLASPGTLERFIEDQETVKKIRSVFTGIYSLDKGLGDEIVSLALENPQDFVVKPQREGGANNFFGEEMRTFLESIKSSDERDGYIMMDMITPPSQKGLILNSFSDEVELCPLICEVGVFGTYVRCDGEVLCNMSGGPLARSKRADANEGGIISFGGAVDSIELVPTSEFLEIIEKS